MRSVVRSASLRHFDQRHDLQRFANVTSESSRARNLGGDGVGGRLIATYNRDDRAAFGQRSSDGAADAARTAGHQGNFSREINFHYVILDSRASTSGTVPQVIAGLFGARRFSSPVSTLPGPISTKVAVGWSAAIA